MRKYSSSNNTHLSRFNPNPNQNPILNPNPGSVRQIHDPSTGPHVHQQSPRTDPPPAANNTQKESFHGGYVTFHLGAYSKGEVKELKKRLISELEHVRSLKNKFASRSAPHFNRSPPLQLGPPALDPPIAAVVSPSGGKKTSGKKRAMLCASGGRDRKRIAGVGVDLSPLGKLRKGVMRKCRDILTKLMKHKHGWVFNKPVDVIGLGLHDYHMIIKNPMDLGTVKARLSKHEYESPQDFAADVRLTFDNAMTYNLKGQDVHVMAEMLMLRFQELYYPVFQRYDAELARAIIAAEQVRQKTLVALENVRRPSPEPVMADKISDLALTASLNPTMVQLKAPAIPTVNRPAVVLTPRPGKLRKPKAKDENKREMTFEEKEQLGVSLENLPQDRTDQMLRILNKRNSEMAQDGDEMELDLEKIDNETLWELDRLVENHKAVNKIKRQVLVANLMSGQQLDKLPDCELEKEGAAQMNKKVDVMEEYVDIGEDIPITNFPPVEIEKDAVYVSSNSSSSSSSDSDSGSSSGSDSASSVRSPYFESREAPAA
ncbi:hypothetical protein RJ639_009604 [Escallonia herrerae]|uniref:Uncharacterized protein n=1 Tax=Escallonia herrerae TaxID=1293975 RepID=A0AA88VSJ7_9ASTE|nr:hypothetical protein RJ639_009604 [Escallonia herrerae]